MICTNEERETTFFRNEIEIPRSKGSHLARGSVTLIVCALLTNACSLIEDYQSTRWVRTQRKLELRFRLLREELLSNNPTMDCGELETRISELSQEFLEKSDGPSNGRVHSPMTNEDIDWRFFPFVYGQYAAFLAELTREDFAAAESRYRELRRDIPTRGGSIEFANMILPSFEIDAMIVASITRARHGNALPEIDGFVENGGDTSKLSRYLQLLAKTPCLNRFGTRGLECLRFLFDEEDEGKNVDPENE